MAYAVWQGNLDWASPRVSGNHALNLVEIDPGKNLSRMSRSVVGRLVKDEDTGVIINRPCFLGSIIHEFNRPHIRAGCEIANEFKAKLAAEERLVVFDCQRVSLWVARHGRGEG